MKTGSYNKCLLLIGICALTIITIPTKSIAQFGDYNLISSEFMIFEPMEKPDFIDGCYACSSEKYLFGVRVDSSSSIDGEVTYYFNRQIVDYGSNCFKLGPSVLGDSIIEEDGGISRCYTFDGMELIFDRMQLLGQSSHLTEFDNGNYITITVESVNFESFLGVSDSVKTYFLQLYSQIGEPLESPINNQFFKLSKNNGLIQSFNFRDLSSTSWPSTLLLISNSQLNPSETSLSYHDIYDFEVLDEFHFKVQNLYLGLHGYDYVIRKVLSKTNYPAGDSIRYTYTEHHYGLRIKNEPGSSDYESFEFDTVYEEVYYELSKFILSPNILPFEVENNMDIEYVNSLMYKNPSKFNDRYIIRKYGQQFPIEGEEECSYPPPDSWGGTIIYFIVGLGHLTNDITVELYEECNPCENLIYYKKGVETWGEPLSNNKHFIDSTPLKVFPNPAQDYIYIDCVDEIQSLQIYSIHGTQMDFFKGHFHEDYQIDVSKYKPGLYFIEIKTSESELRVLKFVIE